VQKVPGHAHDLIEQWVEPSSRVLDLGCGDGSLLDRLKRSRQVDGIGVEISQDMIVQCLSRGLSVYQADIDRGLSQWDDLSFDYVILNATLLVTHKPYDIITEMLRVGRYAVISVSNFGFLPNRASVLFRGSITGDVRAAGTWHDSPVIRFVCLDEFRASLREMGIDIMDARHFLPLGIVTRTRIPLDNLLVREAVFLLRRGA